MEYRSIYITAKDEPEAQRLAKTLVWEKLGACANYFPVKSVYWWEGQVQEAGEIAIIAKTRADLVDRVIQRVRELHSYQVPCIESWIIEKANKSCLDWIDQSVE